MPVALDYLRIGLDVWILPVQSSAGLLLKATEWFMVQQILNAKLANVIGEKEDRCTVMLSRWQVLHKGANLL